MMLEILARIEAPHFVCGIVLKGDHVAVAASIVRYMGGWHRDRVRDYCRDKGWKISIVRQTQLQELQSVADSRLTE
jgi:hypothetical protein